MYLLCKQDIVCPC